MKTVRIYQTGNYDIGQQVELSPEAAQHVSVVLRMQAGDSLTLFNGTNCEFPSIITHIKKKQVIVAIEQSQECNKESALNIHLAQAISKGDRMEWVMQKSVELGVHSITPLLTERCAVKVDKERLQKKVLQWQAIVIAACEQCGRNTVPVVHPPVTFATFLPRVQTQLKLILHPQDGKSWRDYPLNEVSNITLLIGPEGGFSAAELRQALEHTFAPLQLGPRILRTETAAISALSLLQAVGGDL